MAAVLPVMSSERGAEAPQIFQGSLLLVSGVYYPVEVLPRWLQPLSMVSPATYTLSACRKLIGVGNSVSAGPSGRLFSVGGCTGTAGARRHGRAVLMPLGLWVFGRIEAWAKRAGKLKRTG